MSIIIILKVINETIWYLWPQIPVFTEKQPAAHLEPHADSKYRDLPELPVSIE